MKKNPFIRFFCFLLAAIIPFAAISGIVIFSGDAYTETFLGELPYKVERLDTLESPKIIVIGGSSVAFGLDSAMLEEYTGLPVVNFGLYADLGTKIMLDLAIKSVKDGDIVVIAPELDSQTLSLFFNGESAWRACEGRLSLLTRIGKDNISDMIGSVFGYLTAKMSRLATGDTSSSGVYSRSAFNAYGDISFYRPYNIMSVGYDISKPVSFGTDIFSGDFIDYVNDFAGKCEKLGATVCWSFPPVNESGIEAGTASETYSELYAWLCGQLNFEIISNPGDYVMPSEYFYDTNFHTNTAGTARHTYHLACDLRRFLGITGLFTCDLPEPEEKPATDDTGESSWSQYFIFSDITDTGGQIIGLAVCGMTEEGKSLPSVEIPSAHDGKKVIQIKAGCFDGCTSLGSVTIKSNIESMENGAFAGCPSLSKVHIYKETEIIIDQTLLTEGAPDGMKFVFHDAETFNLYSTGYFWANYCGRMVLAD